MPSAAEVHHSKFPVDEVLYDHDGFSIAWGVYDGERRCLGMRWNGEEGDAGYPKLFKNPVWFVLPAELTIPILKSLLDTPTDHSGVLKVLGELEKAGELK